MVIKEYLRLSNKRCQDRVPGLFLFTVLVAVECVTIYMEYQAAFTNGKRQREGRRVTWKWKWERFQAVSHNQLST